MLINVKQLCENLGVSRKTAYEYVKEGMPAIWLSKKVLRFDWEEVQEWYKTKRVG